MTPSHNSKLFQNIKIAMGNITKTEKIIIKNPNSGMYRDIIHAITIETITPSNSLCIWACACRYELEVSTNFEIQKVPNKKRQIKAPKNNFMFVLSSFKTTAYVINILSNATPIIPKDIATGRNNKA